MRRWFSRLGATALALAGAVLAPAAATPVGAGALADRTGTIAYARFTLGADAQLFTVDANGRNRARLIRHNGSDSEPSWSPDGRRIAFTSTNAAANQGIFVASVDGGDIKQLTSHLTPPNATFLDAHPRWSPDGARIVFHRYRNSRTTLFVMNADGSGLRQLGSGFEPAWSPDGRRIAFADRIGALGNYDIYTIDAAGSDRRRVTRSPVNDNDPDWSPDGRTLAFESRRNDNTDIYTIRPDGTGERRLTTAGGYDVAPVWSPNGSWIAFASRRMRSQFDIWVMNRDGSGQTRLTTDVRADEVQPAWRPAAR